MPKVNKLVLSNGLTILVVQQKNIPKVSVQLLYNVGSKDERESEKGIAHLIEHMIFKGTQKLSESDINLITHKLSGYCNAFTSYDYTGYLFDFPSQNWHESLPILADCMQNCTFKQEFLDSEFKAVIQELKMYKDDYATSIIEQMFANIFPDHPYHYPIIGYKQDLWNMRRENLVNFYKHHYIPNNAVLVVVGDVDISEVFERAQQAFGQILPDLNYKKETFYHSIDLRSTTVSIYRDLQQPIVMLGWVIPGSNQSKDYVIDIFSWILANGKGSRLHKKLVDELQLLTDLECFTFDLIEHGLFFIKLQLKKLKDLDNVIGIIHSEVENIRQAGPSEIELNRAIRKTEVEYLQLMENIQKQAYGIGKCFLATGNEQYLYTYTEYPKENLSQEIKDLASSYIKPSIMHTGKVLPIESSEKSYWTLIQNVSDFEDSRVLSGRSRTAQVEKGKAVNAVHSNKAKFFKFAQSDKWTLNNGLKVLYCQNNFLPKADLILDFKAKYYYDPDLLQGLNNFVLDMFLEGTEKYSANKFADILESHGMMFSASNGQIRMSMLIQDLPLGLELLSEVVSKAMFDEIAVEKIRAQILADISNYWDSPIDFLSQIAREAVYKNHPYSKSPIGNTQSINYITKQDLVNYYKKYISPKGARLSIVANIESKDLIRLLEESFINWPSTEFEDIIFPKLNFVEKKEIDYPIDRDQVVLAYVGLSVSRDHADYDKLLLFDQIFTGGVLGSMSSRLFDLRESSGLFYTIGGSIISKATKQPGIISIKTLVSNDRLQEAQSAIEDVIDKVVYTIDPEELIDAKNAVINSLVDNFGSYMQTAQAMLAQDIYEFPENYFDTRAQQLSSITLEDVQEATKKYLGTDKLAKIRIGRVI